MHNETVTPISTQDPFAGLGEALHRLRKTRGLSQTDLASQTGLAHGQVSAIEAGKQKPSLESLSKLMRTLGCDLDELSSALKSVRG
ncbi:MAG TPA: helix-turn-helix transcriptional regulator [Thermoanaerobaculia bacterium]|nr:helix-turn-helix transcriptional regulator [Thermoanaerobaculia bacterium]